MGCFLEKQSVLRSEKFRVILDVIDRVGHALSQASNLSDGERLKAWVEILEWGVKELPEGYEKTYIPLDTIVDPQLNPPLYGAVCALRGEVWDTILTETRNS